MNGLQLMAVEIDDESGIVGVAVLWPRPRSAAIGAAGAQGCHMERVHRVAIGRIESQMKARTWSCCLSRFCEQRQFVAAPFFSKAHRVRLGPNPDVSKGH